MAGGYTHVTLVQLSIEAALKPGSSLLHSDVRQALGRWKKFAIIGSVAPDYPYLDVLSGSAGDWADAMHKGNPLVFLREAMKKVRTLQNDSVRQKCLAWLLGAASHSVTDGTVHPVVNLKVGPYEQNKTAHRVCEMSQDVYAHTKLNLGALDINRQLSVNVQGTSDSSDADKMDRDISTLWIEVFNTLYRKGSRYAVPYVSGQESISPSAPPDPDAWHQAIRRLMTIAVSGGSLIPFARHVAANIGLVYPAVPDPQYIKGLSAPGNKTMDFEQVFQKALSNVVAFWGDMSLVLQGKTSPIDSMAGWSLDTGLDTGNKLVFWR